MKTKASIRKITNETQQGEKQAAAEATHQNNMWWRLALKRQGLGRIWRKVIVSQILIEER